MDLVSAGWRTVERLNSANTTDHKYLKRIEKGVEIREINSSFSPWSIHFFRFLKWKVKM